MPHGGSSWRLFARKSRVYAVPNPADVQAAVERLRRGVVTIPDLDAVLDQLATLTAEVIELKGERDTLSTALDTLERRVEELERR